MKLHSSWKQLRQEIVECRRCPRLVAFRESVVPKGAFQDQTYWHRPVPGFGDPNAWLLIIGLAPAPHGGNRTGRIFTGDLTAKFLMRGLFNCGLANQPTSLSAEDGLQLKGCFMTAAVKCVPPNNKPTTQECINCSEYLHRELTLLRSLDSILALGKLAFEAYLNYAKKQGATFKRPAFKHGGVHELPGLPTLYASYHPTPRNTQTGTLTEQMFEQVLAHIIERHHDKNKKNGL